MSNQILADEQELNLLKQAFQLLNNLVVQGSRQAGILAQAADAVANVANSLNAKVENTMKAQALLQATENAKPELSLVPPTGCNGDCVKPEVATQ